MQDFSTSHHLQALCQPQGYSSKYAEDDAQGRNVQTGGVGVETIQRKERPILKAIVKGSVTLTTKIVDTQEEIVAAAAESNLQSNKN